MSAPVLPTAALLLALCWSTSASAQIYRCVDPADGHTSFTDQPCALGHTGTAIPVPEPNIVDTSGSREQILLREMEAMRERLRAAEAAQSQGSVADHQAERIDSFSCAQAQRAYEMAAGALKENDAAIEAKRAAMYGACGLREPDRVEVIQQEVIVPRYIRRQEWYDNRLRYPEPPPRYTGRERMPAPEPMPTVEPRQPVAPKPAVAQKPATAGAPAPAPVQRLPNLQRVVPH